MAVRFDTARKQHVIEFQQGRQRVFERCPRGITKAQAQARETLLRRGLFDRVSLGRQDELSLEEAIGRWLEDHHRKNRKQATSEARQWAPFVQGRKLREAAEVAADAVREWRNPCEGGKGRVAKPATINARLACLKAVCRHAHDQGWIGENLSRRIKLQNPRNAREVYLKKSEVASIAKGMGSPQGSAAVWLLAYCGPRISELLGHPKIPRGDSRLRFPARTTKNSKARVVPVPKAARRYLSALPLPYNYQHFYDEFSVAKKAAGLGHVNIHDLRHTAASWLINAGVDLYTVAAILGDTLQQAQRYAHLADTTLEKAMARLR